MPSQAELGTMSTEALWAVVVVLLIPALVAIVVKTVWSARAKRATVIVISALVAATDLFVRGEFNTSDLVRTTFILALMATGVYHRFQPQFTRLEEATDPSPRAGPEKVGPLG